MATTLLAVGQQVNIQLRTGEWIRSSTILSAANNTITVSRANGSTATLNAHADIVVVEAVSGVSVSL